MSPARVALSYLEASWVLSQKQGKICAACDFSMLWRSTEQAWMWADFTLAFMKGLLEPFPLYPPTKSVAWTPQSSHSSQSSNLKSGFPGKSCYLNIHLSHKNSIRMDNHQHLTLLLPCLAISIQGTHKMTKGRKSPVLWSKWILQSGTEVYRGLVTHTQHFVHRLSYILYC